MNKRWAALLAVLCLAMALCGCAATEPTPATEAEQEVTADNSLDGIVTEDMPQTAQSMLNVTVTVANNEEINPFITNVSAMQPASYTNTRKVDGVETTYTLRYEGSPTLEATVLIENEDGRSEQTAQLFLSPYYGFFPDATGENLDVEAYIDAIDELGLTPVMEQKSLQTLYGVYALGFVDVLGQAHIVDFWLNEQEVYQIELMQLLQGGGMVMQ